jgi:hypothetical protein
MDLATFIRTGGWQAPGRSAKLNALLAHGVQAHLNTLWTEKYGTCTPDEKEKVNQLIRDGLSPSAAMQLFFACRKDITQAQMALRDC